jgi:hypothetical protein
MLYLTYKRIYCVLYNVMASVEWAFDIFDGLSRLTPSTGSSASGGEDAKTVCDTRHITVVVSMISILTGYPRSP